MTNTPLIPLLAMGAVGLFIAVLILGYLVKTGLIWFLVAALLLVPLYYILTSVKWETPSTQELSTPPEIRAAMTGRRVIVSNKK
jgi:uncharacterized membrane protein YfcA